MPASLQSISIRGVRSYSPSEYKTQTVEFMPLTLIVGANGSGKTTIIESLKFIISGEEPPLSDSRRNFIHSSEKPDKSLDKNISYSCIKLDFTTSRDEKCVAKREIQKAGGARVTPSVSSSYKIGNRAPVQVHRQEDWLKAVPMLFNLPNQALLNNVILCHQDNSLWCMSDSSTVKQVFDKIFGCEEYKKEIKHIDAEIKSSKTDIAIKERDITHLKDKIEYLDRMESELKNSLTETERIEAEVGKLDANIIRQTKIRTSLEEQSALSKRDTAELEDKLLSNYQALARQSADLRATCQGLIQRLRTKESYVKKLEEQIAKTSPIAKDLAHVTNNLKEMLIVTSSMTSSLQVETLNRLIKESEVIIENLLLKLETENVNKLKEDLLKESKEIETSKALLKSTELQNEEVVTKQTQAKEEHSKVRALSKESDCGQAEIQKVEKELSELRDKRSRLVGAKTQIKRDISRIELELRSESNVKIKYAESLGSLVCNQIVISDLEKLKECFQHSIISFHDQMIIKINEVLKARWRQIYQGTDIERIELVDEEITKGKDKKSYNYYIAMRKGGIRMKMREKSSAGQKALASIILRMTLAELFVKDFAFIALDEPTANLDLANVRSLAKSIGYYVRRRSMKGMNIQWIIITHDEQFLQALNSECSPFYYKVQLDDEGNSKIIKLSFQDQSANEEEGA